MIKFVNWTPTINYKMLETSIWAQRVNIKWSIFVFIQRNKEIIENCAMYLRKAVGWIKMNKWMLKESIKTLIIIYRKRRKREKRHKPQSRIGGFRVFDSLCILNKMQKENSNTSCNSNINSTNDHINYSQRKNESPKKSVYIQTYIHSYTYYMMIIIVNCVYKTLSVCKKNNENETK